MLKRINHKSAPKAVINAFVTLYNQGRFDDVISLSSHLIKEYPPGEPENKPDVLEQIKTITDQREKMIEEAREKAASQETSISINYNGKDINLTNNQIIEILNQQQEQIKRLLQELEIKNKLLENVKLENIN